MKAASIQTLENATTIADGIRVRRPGDLTFPVIRRRARELVAVPDEDIAEAIVFLLERCKLVVEPAGAVGVAALLSGRTRFDAAEKVVVLLSGGNIDVNLAARIIEHGLTRAGRYFVLRVRLLDKPGQLAGLLRPLAEMRVNVIDIEHHRAGWLIPIEQSEVVLHLETRHLDHCREILSTLRRLGYDAEPLSGQWSVASGR